MNKQDLIAKLATGAKVSKSQAGALVDGLIEAITKELKKGGEVRLTGFGTFKIAKRKATTGRNPRTGQTIKISAKNSPKFQAGKSLKDAVN
ncbi:MAG TPA: HU family DNA-binding protein [Alphaproteobacteria bacterium]|nr:HU family DNA-binding protein [Alphaproteobacteria bacterium]